MLGEGEQHKIEYGHGQADKPVLDGVQACAQTHFEHDEGKEGQADEQCSIFYRAFDRP